MLRDLSHEEQTQFAEELNAGRKDTTRMREKDEPMAISRRQQESVWWHRVRQKLRRLTGVAISAGCLFLVGALFPQAVWAQVTLENPQPDSAQSGIGVISGWACDANQVEIEFDNDSANRWRAGTGTTRTDTQGVCGDADNGFGLLFNWNLLGDGTHTVRAFADGVEFANVTVIVTTLEEEFRRGASGEFPVADFPTPGTALTLQWQEAQQNFVITDGSPVSGNGGTSGGEEQILENPQPGSAQSGIGVISGCVCDANQIEIEFDNDAANRWRAGYGTTRADTKALCGDTNNGFGLLFNWNLLGAGSHTVRAFADGVEFANVTVTVTTLGEEFVRGVTHDMSLPDFPEAGTDVQVQWQEAQQNFVIAAAATTQRLVEVTPTLVLPAGVSIPNVEISSLYTDGAEVPASPEPSLLLAVDEDGTVLLAIADQDGGLLGEAQGRVEVSVDSTAVTLIGLIAGIAVSDMTQSVVADIQAHAQYQPVVAAMTTQLAADKNFLDSLYDFPDIVNSIRQIAGSLAGPMASSSQVAGPARSMARGQAPSPTGLLESILQALTDIPRSAHAQAGGTSDPDCAHKRAKTLEKVALTAIDQIYPVKDAIVAVEAIRDAPSVSEAFRQCAQGELAKWQAANPGQTPPPLPEWDIQAGQNIPGGVPDSFGIELAEYHQAAKWQANVIRGCTLKIPNAYRGPLSKVSDVAKNVGFGKVVGAALKTVGKVSSWLGAIVEGAQKGAQFGKAANDLVVLASTGCTDRVDAAGERVRDGTVDPARARFDMCVAAIGVNRTRELARECNNASGRLRLERDALDRDFMTCRVGGTEGKPYEAEHCVEGGDDTCFALDRDGACDEPDGPPPGGNGNDHPCPESGLEHMPVQECQDYPTTVQGLANCCLADASESEARQFSAGGGGGSSRCPAVAQYGVDCTAHRFDGIIVLGPGETVWETRMFLDEPLRANASCHAYEGGPQEITSSLQYNDC